MKTASQQTAQSPVLVFYSYAHEDEGLRDELEKHLSVLQHQGLIVGWYDHLILPGTDWAREIDDHLRVANLVLLLISADFLASEYCFGIEMNIALERHAKNLCRIIPVLLRPCDWQNARFASLQCLPGKKAITQYDNRDVAFDEIAKGIRKVIEQMNSSSRSRAPIDRKHRQHLLQSVYNFWIEGILNNSLHHAALIALGLQEQPDAIANPWHMVMQESERPAYPLPSTMKILDVFERAGGHLLILGEPGAGKTTLLLELTRDLLDRAQRDESQPIPVVFLLSSWAQKRQALSDWMVEELKTKYEIAPEIAHALVRENQILPLFDGFDEVAEDRRASCLSAINAYRQICPSVSMVVCSRKDEYNAQEDRLVLKEAILVQPLTVQQIEEYLTRAGLHLEAIRGGLHDKGLRELLTTPLWLSVVTLAYQGISVEDLIGVAPEKLHQLIFEKYVERMLTRRAKGAWAVEEIQRWLAWLAQKMKQHYLTEFSFKSTTADWFVTPSWRSAPLDRYTLAGYSEFIDMFADPSDLAFRLGGIGGVIGRTLGPIGMISGMALGGATGLALQKSGQTEKGLEKFVGHHIWRSGGGPKNYRDFLDYAADHILLRKVGKNYLFVHQLFLDYFASLDISTTAN